MDQKIFTDKLSEVEDKFCICNGKTELSLFVDSLFKVVYNQSVFNTDNVNAKLNYILTRNENELYKLYKNGR